MQPAFQAQGAAIVAEVGHAVPVRRWHATGLSRQVVDVGAGGVG